MARRRAWRWAIAAAIVLLALGVWLGHYLRSPAFTAMVKERLATGVAQATGAKVEIGSVRVNLLRMEIFADDVTLHGREQAGSPPLGHAAEVYARLSVESLVPGKTRLRALRVEQPVVHISVAKDGKSNLPAPAGSAGGAAQKLFDSGIERLELSNGTLSLNQRGLPLNLVADDVNAAASYSRAARSFGGAVDIGRVVSAIRNWRPFAWSIMLNFELRPNRLDIRSLRWKSEDSWIEAEGRVPDLAQPELDARYQAHFDLRQVARIARQPELRGGAADTRGSGKFSAAGFSTQARVALHQVRMNSAAPPLSAEADVTVANRGLQVDSLRGTWAGGEFSGMVRTSDWMSAFGRSAKSAAAGHAEIRLRGVGAAELLRWLYAALPQLAKFVQSASPAAVADGMVSLNWRGALRNSSARFNAQLHPPKRPPAGSLPLSGTLVGSYQAASKHLQFDHSEIQTPASTLTADGELDERASEMRVSARTTDLSELLRLEQVLQPGYAPRSLRGSGEINAVITGDLRQPALSGNFDLQNVTADFAEAGRSGGVATGKFRRFNADSVQADFAIGASSATLERGTVKRDGATLKVSANTRLQDYAFGPDSRFWLVVESRSATLAGLEDMFGAGFPVRGTATLQARVEGTRQDPQGTASLVITDGAVYGAHFKSLTAQAEMGGGEISVRDIKLALSQAVATGAAGYNLRSQSFDFHLDAADLDLARIPALQSPRFSVAGTLALQARGAGTLERPAIQATATASNLVLNGEKAGSFTLQATTHGGVVELSSRSHLERGSLAISGNIGLRDPWPAQIKAGFARLDVDPILRAYLLGEITEHSAADGDATLAGDLRNPASLVVEGELGRVAADVENVKLASAAPIEFSVRNKTLKVSAFHIVGQGTDLSAAGTVALARAGAIAAHADGELNLKILESFNPNLVSYGLTTLAVNLGGTVAAPAVTGTMKIQDAGFSLLDLPTGVSGLNGTMFFNQDRLEIQSLTAQTGGGLLQLTGYVAYSRGLYFDIAANGREVRLRYPPGVSATADAQLKFAGTLKNSLLAGDIRVTKFSVSQDFDFGYYLGKVTAPEPVPAPGSILNTLHFNIHVVSARQLDVQLSLAKLSGDADLRLRGTAARPVLLGRININEGNFSFSGTNYHLDRGSLTFLNPIRLAPVLDMQASARVRDYDITLTFHGPLDKLTTSYRSDPPLPSGDIIALLALGHTRQDELANTPAQATLANVATGALLGQALNAATGSRVQRLFGISRIKIDPIGNPEVTGTTQAGLGPTVTVEQQASNRVTLTYIRNLAQSTQQVIEVEFQINRNTSVDAIRDQNGVFGMDIKIRQRKR